MGWLKDLWYSPKKYKEHAVEFWPQLAGREYEKGQSLLRNGEEG